MAVQQVLFPMDPKEFWDQMRSLIEEVISRKASGSAIGDDNNNISQRSLLKAKEVCELFQVSKPTLYQWMNEGKLKSIKIQSRRFFLQHDIDELIKASRSETSMAK